MPRTPLDRQCLNALRVLVLDAAQRTGGTPDRPLRLVEVAYTLWMRHLRHNPRNPRWPNRDRFVLAADHSAILLYSLLHLTGYPLTRKDLREFRQFDSHTPGSLEYDLDSGIEATGGPPGQGFAHSIGMAVAEQHLAATFNRPKFRLVDHVIYTLVAAEDLLEGVAHEAIALAGAWGLEQLICCYDFHETQTRGVSMAGHIAHFRACGWHIQDIDGHNLDAIDAALRAAKRHVGQPHLIVCRTQSGGGLPEDLTQLLSPDGVAHLKDSWGWPDEEAFFIPTDVVAHYRLAVPQGERAEARWRNLITAYGQAFPELLADFQQRNAAMLPGGWETRLPHYRPDSPPLATGAAIGQVLDAIASVVPELLGGTATLSDTRLILPNRGDFRQTTPAGCNLHFGAGEHAMGSILNGLALHGGVRVYGSTTLMLSDYMRPPIRMAALMRLPVIFVLLDDSFYIGEAGPAHQPVEQLMALRNIPGRNVMRPADANEAVVAWQIALAQRTVPTALILARQALPVLEEGAQKARDGVPRGGYVLRDSPLDRIDLILIATGSEVHDALAAQTLLQAHHLGARVVSLPCWRLYDEQPLFYKLSVLPSNVSKRLAIEAGSTLGWERYVGSYGGIIGLDHFGASGAAADLKQAFGFTPEAIVNRAVALMSE